MGSAEGYWRKFSSFHQGNNTMTNETKPKGNREAGRPRGSKNRARFATKALEKLDMSPLSDLLRLLNEHYIRVHDNDRSNAPSTKHTGELLQTRGKMLRSLLVYQYTPLREVTEKITSVKPMRITLTPRKKEPENDE